MTLSELQTKRDALLTSIANAHKQLTSGDKSVTYQDISQMEKSLAILDNEIEKANGTATVKRYRIYTREH